MSAATSIMMKTASQLYVFDVTGKTMTSGLALGMTMPLVLLIGRGLGGYALSAATTTPESSRAATFALHADGSKTKYSTKTTITVVALTMKAFVRQKPRGRSENPKSHNLDIVSPSVMPCMALLLCPKASAVI